MTNVVRKLVRNITAKKQKEIKLIKRAIKKKISKYQYIYSKINLSHSGKKLVIFGLIFACALAIGKTSPTNSFFSDKAVSQENRFEAGYWIPELEGSYVLKNPDGKNDWYITSPSVILSAKIGFSEDESTIYYENSDDGDPVKGGHKYENLPVKIPDGKIDFQAQAVNDENPADWRSEVISYHFEVDTLPPSVPKWENPARDAFTHQVKDIRMSWQDSHDVSSGVAGYLYEVQEPGDHSDWKKSFSDCGLLESTHVPTGDTCFSGSAVKLDQGEGEYERRIKAVDKAGNESGWAVGKIKLDTTPPVTEVTAASHDGDNPMVARIEFKASDNLAGVKEVKLFYRKDGGGWHEYEDGFDSSWIKFDATDIGEGDYDFYTIGEDKADDLSSADMTSGNGDNGKGNIETKAPSAEKSIHIELPIVDPPVQS